MEKFLGTLITILLIFYIVKLLFRLLMPFFLKLFVKNINKKFENMSGQQFGGNPFGNGAYSAGSQYQNSTNSQEGDVSIDMTKAYRKTNDKGQTLSEELGGEYVDYEEVK